MTPFCYLVTGREMSLYDHNTIEYLKVPALILMEQAALAVVEEVGRLFSPSEGRVLILAGGGNNGADALAVARLLIQRNYEITVFYLSDKPPEKLGELPGLQYEMLKKMGARMVTELPLEEYAMVIDGVFGVGLSRPVSGERARILEKVSGWKSLKLAIDVPSGLDSNTGKVLGTAFRADVTVTFGFLKLGLCLYPGVSHAGRIVVKEIGITAASFLDEPPRWIALLGNPARLLPKRPSEGHKGTFGKVLVVAGNEDIGGAPYLAALGALRTGCGMVRICTHRNQQSALTSLLPEALLDVYADVQEALSRLDKGLAWADIVIFGPGTGTASIAFGLLQKILRENSLPLIIDADGINLLAATDLGEELKALQEKEENRRALILTPHLMELCRLTGESVERIRDRDCHVLEKAAQDYRGIVVQKDARTLIMDHTGRGCVNLCGNSGMATAGSGDLLTGIIGALLAQKMEGFKAACLGVYLHGKAGDEAAAGGNEYSLTASDMGQALIALLRKNKEIVEERDETL